MGVIFMCAKSLMPRCMMRLSWVAQNKICRGGAMGVWGCDTSHGLKIVNLLGRFEICQCRLGRQSADGLDQICPKHGTPLTLGVLCRPHRGHSCYRSLYLTRQAHDEISSFKIKVVYLSYSYKIEWRVRSYFQARN